jgi:hypothetical protein
MSVLAPLVGFVRPELFRLDTAPTFPAGQTASYNAALNAWICGSPSQTIHTNQLDATATAIERLYQQDFAGSAGELDGFDIDPVFAPDGVTVLVAGFRVQLTQLNDAPNKFAIGGWANVDPTVAFAFCAMVRQKLGIGTPYTP